MFQKCLMLFISTFLAIVPAAARKKQPAAAQEEDAVYDITDSLYGGKEADGPQEADGGTEEAAESRQDNPSEDYAIGTAEAEDEKAKKINWVTGLTSPFAHPLVIGSYNRFILKSDWALVEWEDVNHYRKMKFDHDWYWTNFVLHPYQGNLAYMGARNSNFNFIGSLYTRLQYGEINDMI